MEHGKVQSTQEGGDDKEEEEEEGEENRERTKIELV